MLSPKLIQHEGGGETPQPNNATLITHTEGAALSSVTHFHEGPITSFMESVQCPKSQSLPKKTPNAVAQKSTARVNLLGAVAGAEPMSSQQ